MKVQLIRVLCAAMGLALVVAATALAKPEVVKEGNLFLRDNGGISPTRLPRNKPAPITGHINGTIGTLDGSHPPALESVVADFDKTIHVNAKGLPACRLSKLVAQSTAHA